MLKRSKLPEKSGMISDILRKISCRVGITALIATMLVACQTTRESDVFAGMDKNRDGKLDVTEAETYGFKRMFNRFDTNKDNVITADDMEGRATNLLRQRDLNRDGQVTYDEYASVGRKLGLVKKFFMAADVNGDDLVSREELKAYMSDGGGALLTN